MLHAIYFIDSWDRGMGWTVRYSCVSERDRWTFPTIPWDGMDSRTHAFVEGQVDIPWKVPWGCGIGWTIPCNPMIPWDRGMGWTIYGISGQPSISSHLEDLGNSRPIWSFIYYSKAIFWKNKCSYNVVRSFQFCWSAKWPLLHYWSLPSSLFGTHT